MVRHLLSAYSAHQPSAQSGRHDVLVIFDAFVLDSYLPHVKLRKRSWSVDECIARQHLFPTFGDRRLADIQRHEVEIWQHRCQPKGWPQPPATAFWQSLRPSTPWRKCAAFFRPGNRRAWESRLSKSTRSGNVISRWTKCGGSCGRGKSDRRKPSPPHGDVSGGLKIRTHFIILEKAMDFG